MTMEMRERSEISATVAAAQQCLTAIKALLVMALLSLCVNVFQPGESWLLEDGCHSVLCNPNGALTVQNHKVSCDRLEPPACSNNMPPVRVQETCGCHWECPCTYTMRIR